MNHNHHKEPDKISTEKKSCCHHPAHAPQQPAQSKGPVIYTCPMHADIRQDNPGNCPICGMALEPETISAEEEHNPEYQDMNRRLWIALVLSLPVFILAMSEHLLNQWLPIHLS
ncbi:TPA: heavy metal-binding domain-containing protein, partial [Legionella pneumophila]